MLNKKIISLFMILLLASSASLFAVESSFGAHLTSEIAPNGTFQVHPGLDFRLLGGRGMVGSELSIDYFPMNSRGYNSNFSSSMLMISGFALAQVTMYYGDMAVYMGPGTSYYYMPLDGGDTDGDGEIDGAGYSSLIEDSLIHWKTGFHYTLYPMQFLAEIDFDITFAGFGLANPNLKLGFSYMR